MLQMLAALRCAHSQRSQHDQQGEEEQDNPWPIISPQAIPLSNVRSTACGAAPSKRQMMHLAPAEDPRDGLVPVGPACAHLRRVV